MKKNVLILIFAILIIFLIVFCIFRLDIYKAITPNVETTSIGPMFLDGIKYDIAVQNDHIHKTNDGFTYVLLAKRRVTFWYSSNYCHISEIKIIAQNNTHSAIEFVGDYTEGDELIVKFEDNLTNGQDIYIVR